MADFETVSTSSLQIRVKVPRSPSPSCIRGQPSVLRSSSMRQSRLEATTVANRPPKNTLSVNRSGYSRSLSPRPLSSNSSSQTTSRPPPPSPASGSCLLPTRSPTPPQLQISKPSSNSLGVASRSQRSLSPRCCYYLHS